MELIRAKRFYFVGLAGAGMSSIARVLVRLGYEVFGWDDAPEPQVQAMLEAENIQFLNWQQVNNVDAVVYSTAISSQHPAMLWADEHAITQHHRSDILAWLSYKMPTIAVCGSHGKTTTASMVHHLLTRAGVPHVTILGGILNGQIGGQVDTKPQWLIIEACESDRTFLKYQADYVILTNLSADHLEYYGGSMDGLIEAFAGWLNELQPVLLIPAMHPAIQKLMDQTEMLAVYRVGEDVDYTYHYEAHGLEGVVNLTNGRDSARYGVPAPGAFNGSNAAMALALADLMGLDLWSQPQVFSDYQRVGRRFEYAALKTSTGEDLHWVSDYGHHPVEILAIIQTVRALWPDLPIRMVFEPHRYTRTHAQFSVFVEVLSQVDHLVILPIYAASEAAIEGVSSEALVQAIGKPTHRSYSAHELLDALASWSATPAIILFQGAGMVHACGKEWLASCHVG